MIRAVVEERIDGPAGSWRHAEWSPAPGDPLHGDVERIWFFRGAVTEPLERVFPDGRLQIVVQLDGRRRPAGARHDYPALCFTGMQVGPLLIEAPVHRPTTVLGIRLTPAGAYRVLAAPLGAFVGADIALDDAIDRAAGNELGECCALAPNAPAVIAAAHAWVVRRLARACAPAHDVVALVHAIERSGGALAIDALAKPVRTRFRETIGLPPKRFARIVRFGRALRMLQDGRTPLDTAVAAGFYDQAHLTSEMRAFAGRTPAELRRGLRFGDDGTSVAETAGSDERRFFQDASTSAALS